MGYYIETPGHFEKDTQLVAIHGAKRVDSPNSVPEGHVPICVVQNGFFDAAAICYDAAEVAAFNDPSDYRPKTWLSLPRDVVLTLNPDAAKVL